MRLDGLAVIAARLGVRDPRTVLAYAARRRDPLRLRLLLGAYWIRADRLDAWQARRRSRRRGGEGDGEQLARVDGLRGIAAAIGRSIATIKRLARRADDPLPIEGLGGRSPWIFEAALRDWIDGQDQPARAAALAAMKATPPAPPAPSSHARRSVRQAAPRRDQDRAA